jgi:hypothetical protein
LVPTAEALQRPSLPGAAQVSQAPSHSLSQHTPSKQRPPMHCASLVQALPRSLSGLTQAPSPLQSWPSGQASAQQALPPPTAGSQLAEPHSAAVWQAVPLGERQAPRPKHWSPSPQLLPLGSATQVPVPSQLSHVPPHASRQQTPSTQDPSAQSMSLWQGAPNAERGSAQSPASLQTPSIPGATSAQAVSSATMSGSHAVLHTPELWQRLVVCVSANVAQVFAASAHEMAGQRSSSFGAT